MDPDNDTEQDELGNEWDYPEDYFLGGGGSYLAIVTGMLALMVIIGSVLAVVFLR